MTVCRRAIRAVADRNAKYDVVVFPPAGGNTQSIINGYSMWRNPVPWKRTALTPNIGVLDQTDDIRPGMGWDGVAHLQRFVQHGAVLMTSENAADFVRDVVLTPGVTSHTPSGRNAVVGTLLRTRIVDAASPIMYGVPDPLAVNSEEGATFSVSNPVGGRRGNNGEAITDEQLRNPVSIIPPA